MVYTNGLGLVMNANTKGFDKHCSEKSLFFLGQLLMWMCRYTPVN